VLNRPEILNRIGDNIIVFDFIRADVADQIFEAMVTSILSDAATAGYRLSLAPAAKSALRELCVADLSNGGRGIRNKLEAHLINPMARALFEVNGEGAFLIAALTPGVVTTLALRPA
jgi:ATP-dependent Clp protease ATP-binding subunit ClpA